MENNINQDTNNTIADIIQFICYYVGGIISLIILGIILFKHVKNSPKEILIHILIIIIISEILNSIHKIINFFKHIKSINKKIICKIQIFIALFSNICSPLMSSFFSREIYYLIDYYQHSSFSLKPTYYIYLLGFIIPLTITKLFVIAPES